MSRRGHKTGIISTYHHTWLLKTDGRGKVWISDAIPRERQGDAGLASVTEVWQSWDYIMLGFGVPMTDRCSTGDGGLTRAYDGTGSLSQSMLVSSMLPFNTCLAFCAGDAVQRPAQPGGQLGTISNSVGSRAAARPFE